MARRFDRELVKRGAGLRHRALLSLRDAKELLSARHHDPSRLDQVGEELENAAKEYLTLSDDLGDADTAEAAAYFGAALQGTAHLCRWVGATLQATLDAERFLRAAQAGCSFFQNPTEPQESSPEPPTAADASCLLLKDWADKVAATTQISAVSELLEELEKVRLPIFYSRGVSKSKASSKRVATETPQNNGVTVAKVMFSLDGQPLGSPQAIRSGVQHGLDVEIKMAKWPEGYSVFQLDYLTTMASRDYSLSPFKLHREQGNQQNQSGHCIIYNPQSLLSEPALLCVRGRFLADEASEKPQTLPSSLEATIVGHRELKLRALSETAHPVFSGYSTIDIQIPVILQEIRTSLPSLGTRDLDDFTRCLVHVSRYAGMVMQGGDFKGKKVLEQEFQRHLLRSLRMTELSSDVQEGERSAGGILDVRYHNIVIELKVENNVSDRASLRTAYIEQPSQYTAHNVPLSITCILDMTEQEHPPANVANSITLETPPAHGFGSQNPLYPSKVAVIIIDGNVKSPSSYS